LKILTTLDVIALKHRKPIIEALWAYNETYGGGKWSTNKKSLVGMYREVYLHLHDPRLTRGLAVMAKLDSMADYMYTMFQICADVCRAVS
jgi:hypothetical protein